MERHHAQIDHIIWLAGAFAVGSSCGSSLDVFLSGGLCQVEDCLGELPDTLREEFGDFEFEEMFRDYLIQDGKLGFIVQLVAQPPGVDYLEPLWVYGESLNEAIESGLEIFLKTGAEQ
jgi:hypothetical protein